MWKLILGFETYMISDAGKVKNAKGLILKPNHRSGYPFVVLWKKSNPKAMYIHRLVALHFIDNPTNRPHVNHKDGSRDNNHVSNLEWVTPGENIRHARDNDRLNSPVGERAHSSKLTWIKVREIRKMYQNGMSQKDIALKFNVNPSTISDIITKTTWKELSNV